VLVTSKKTPQRARTIRVQRAHPTARLWLDTIANVRIHGETHQRPVDLFAAEQTDLKPLDPLPYDVARIVTARAPKQFHVALDTNHYSVPAQYRKRARDAQSLSRARLRLPRQLADRPTCPQLRSPSGHRGPRASERIPRTTPQCSRTAVDAALPESGPSRSGLLRRAQATACQSRQHMGVVAKIDRCRGDVYAQRSWGCLC
jgi:hypothetical protein